MYLSSIWQGRLTWRLSARRQFKASGKLCRGSLGKGTVLIVLYRFNGTKGFSSIPFLPCYDLKEGFFNLKYTFEFSFIALCSYFHFNFRWNESETDSQTERQSNIHTCKQTEIEAKRQERKKETDGQETNTHTRRYTKIYTRRKTRL